MVARLHGFKENAKVDGEFLSNPGDFYTTLSNKVKTNTEKFCFEATLESARYLSEKVFEYE